MSTDPVVLAAIPMFIIHMLPPGLLEFEMSVALLAEVVISALYVVLPQGFVALEVEIAVIAVPVRVGVFLMLLEGTIVRKPSFTPVTVRHDCGGLKETGVGTCTRVGRRYELGFM